MEKKSFNVRCIFKWPPSSKMRKKYLFEERITHWRAKSIDESIEFADQEAELYAKKIDAEYLGVAQANSMFEKTTSSGNEVSSLLRDSDLESDDYLETFSDAEDKHQK